MQKNLSPLLASFACSLICAANVHAAATPLALRLGISGTCSANVGTKQIVAAAFGTNLAALAFSGTATYDFYSAPLAAPTSLTTADKGGGVIFMGNTSTTSANDFSVLGRMQYFDFNPATGTESLIVDTGNSPHKDVNHGQTVNWAIPNVLLPAAKTLPAGHLVHIAVTITLNSGNPGSYGQLLFNGASGSSSVALFPQNNTVTWETGGMLGINATPGGGANLTCLADSNTSYIIQATTSLVAPVWTPIATNTTDASGLFSYVDLDATNYHCRFYRAVTAD